MNSPCKNAAKEKRCYHHRLVIEIVFQRFSGRKFFYFAADPVRVPFSISHRETTSQNTMYHFPLIIFFLLTYETVVLFVIFCSSLILLREKMGGLTGWGGVGEMRPRTLTSQIIRFSALPGITHLVFYHFSLYISPELNFSFSRTWVILNMVPHTPGPPTWLWLPVQASFTVMRRTFGRYAKARLSFSGGSHAPVNMADSMKNDGSSTVSGSKEAMEVPKNFKDLRKIGVI